MNRKGKRTIGLYFKVSEEERNIISQKMELSGTASLRGYLRKMAVDGYIISIDLSVIKELIILLRTISNNINQIAQRANDTRNIYEEDIQDLRNGYKKVWSEISVLLKKFEKL